MDKVVLLNSNQPRRVKNSSTFDPKVLNEKTAQILSILNGLQICEAKDVLNNVEDQISFLTLEFQHPPQGDEQKQ